MELLKKVHYRLSLLYRKIVTPLMISPSIMRTEETIDYILNNKISVARYGDGEIALMLKYCNICFQTKSEKLSKVLKLVAKEENPKLLVCVPNALYYKENIFNLKDSAYKFWLNQRRSNLYYWIKLFKKQKKLGNSLFTRFYIDYVSFDKHIINKIKGLWAQKEIVIIEGEGTRFGVQNDLISNTKSVERILVPSTNAFETINLIVDYVQKNISKDKLILISAGPTATVLSSLLSKLDYWAIDIGHLDIEYEWYLHKANDKRGIPNKNVNEIGFFIDPSSYKNDEYQRQIIKIIKPSTNS